MKKSKGHIIVNILLAISVLGLAVALSGLFLSTREYRVASKEYEKLAEDYVAPASGGGNTVDFATLRQVNPDFMGWLEIPGTPVNYPVVQNSDNNYYISRTFEGTYNPSGSIFLDANAAPDMSGTNSIIYGHNMKDKSMFAAVQSYNTQPDYQKEHPEIYFYTEDATLIYEVFAARQTTIEDPAYQYAFTSEEKTNAFLKQMDADGRLENGDKIITLSTCVNDGNPTTPNRFIVLAVLREEKPAAKNIPLPASSKTPS